VDDPRDGFEADSYNDGQYMFKNKNVLPTPFEIETARKIQSNWLVLDIGAGNGQFVDFACRKDADVIAVDTLIGNEKVIIARDAVKEAKEKNLFNFVLGTWPDCYTNFKRTGFDLIFSQSALHYLNKAGRHEAFSAIYRSLNNRGYFALALKSIDNAWMEKKDKNGKPVLTRTNDQEKRWYSSIDKSVRTFFTVHGLKEELRQAGFLVQDHHFKTRIISGYEFKNEISVWIEFFYQKN